MAIYSAQNSAGVIKRLTFETLGGDDYVREIRARKGILREIITPKFSVPYSKEGTRIYEFVDRNITYAAIAMRDQIIRLIVFQYPIIELHKALLSFISDTTDINEIIQVRYLPNSDIVSPEVYTNG